MTPEFDEKTRELHAALDRYSQRVRSSNRAAIFFMIALPLAYVFSFVIGLWIFAR